MDGWSFRSLADAYSVSPAQAYLQVVSEMDSLPENAWITQQYCNRWSGRLVVDGKYVKVKGYEKKIPFIYCIDYLTHDIPVGILAPSENEHVFVKLFGILKSCEYPLQIVIADDASPLKPALQRIYPTVPIQRCHTHYLENIRQHLNIRTQEKYRAFFTELTQALHYKNHPKKRDAWLAGIFYRYGQQDPVIQDILADIVKRSSELFAFQYRMQHCPHTTNIIESYNSHLNGRLKTIKGFQSFHSAERWLNAWMIRRRTKPFTDCDKPFLFLNGKTSLEMSIKKDHSWPSLLGIQAPISKR